MSANYSVASQIAVPAIDAKEEVNDIVGCCLTCRTELFSARSVVAIQQQDIRIVAASNLRRLVLRRMNISFQAIEVICRRCGAHLGHVFGSARARRRKRFCTLHKLCLIFKKLPNFKSIKAAR